MKIKILTFFILIVAGVKVGYAQTTGVEDRAYWVETMTKIARPVLESISDNKLKQNMPFESLSKSGNRVKVAYLEAFGRTLCGIAPWLELGKDSTTEGKIRGRYIDMAVRGLSNSVNPDAPDYLTFDKRYGDQSLVDAAFLAHGLLRAPKQIWGNLGKAAKDNVITELKRSRKIKPHGNNWLLFSAIIEAALLEFAGESDSTRLYQGVHRFLNDWYKGDAWYGDGKEFHMDYYNSLVIHPMLTDILIVLQKHNMQGAEYLERQMERLERFAVQQERFISPEGTYPLVGRSIVYRFGAFQALSQASLMNVLPESLPYAQVRCALTAVIKRQLISPDNFDKNGWLRVGFAGSQLNMSEGYINTGSVYLCSTVFLPLGLPASHPFWSDAYTEWTSLKAWNGVDVGRDKALTN